MVIPFPPGGTTDLVGRIVAGKLTEAWGQQVIIDNRPGAGGAMGTEMVANAAPDGHTMLLITITTLVVYPAIYKKLSFDPIKSFQPVSLVLSSPPLLATHPSVPVKSVKDLIQLAKSKPGQLNYASAGSGTSPHLTFEYFKSMTGINVVHVPYKGTGPAINGLVGGEVHMMATGVAVLMPHVKSGRLRAIAVTGVKRLTAFPDIPTIAESGVPTFDVSSSLGVFLPAGTPKPILAKMNGEIHKIMDLPDVRQRLIDQGTDPVTNTPEQFADYVKVEMMKWAEVVKRSGTRAE